MYRKILVPLDGSPFAERVLAQLPLFVTPERTTVVLLRVVGAPHGIHYSDSYNEPPLLSSNGSHEDAEAYLKGAQGELREMGITAKIQVAQGDVASSICEAAEAHSADLIAMTTHGRSGVSRWALGSVADHVVRIARQPVLLVRGASDCARRDAMRRILVPLDGTDLAEQALPDSEALAKENAATLLLLRSVDLHTDRELDGMVEEMDGRGVLRGQRVRAAGYYLSRVERRLQGTGVASQSYVIHEQPAQAIVRMAQAEDVDLIVMSTHARSGLERWVFGSVADKVVRATTCPLLLVHASELGALAG